MNEKNQLREEAERLAAKLDRADKLVNGLAGEYVRWQASIGQYNAALVKVYGDSLIAAAFLSYAGPFETTYRDSLMSSWSKYVDNQQLPVTENFNFTTFLTKSTDVREWNIQGKSTYTHYYYVVYIVYAYLFYYAIYRSAKGRIFDRKRRDQHPRRSMATHDRSTRSSKPLDPQ